MFEVPTDSTTTPKQHESGPNYFAYYKHLVLNLLSRDGKCIIPFTEVDSAGSVGKCFGSEAEGSHNDDRKVNYFSGSCSYFTKTFGEGISEFKEERLLATLNESAVCLNREADEMLDLILATLEIDSNLKEKEQLPRYSNAASNKDLSIPINSKKRKTNSPKSKYSGSNSISFREVYNNIQALQGHGEICHEDVEMYTFQLLAKLDKMEENLDEYLNVVVSNCSTAQYAGEAGHSCNSDVVDDTTNALSLAMPVGLVLESWPMTRIEKHRLGKYIQKLPEKALNRVVEILQPSNCSAKDFPESVVVNLEQQDNVKLWRLYYYVELVLKASKV